MFHPRSRHEPRARRNDAVVWSIVTPAGTEITTSCEPFVEFLWIEERIAVLHPDRMTEHAQAFLLRLADLT